MGLRMFFYLSQLFDTYLLVLVRARLVYIDFSVTGEKSLVIKDMIDRYHRNCIYRSFEAAIFKMAFAGQHMG